MIAQVADGLDFYPIYATHILNSNIKCILGPLRNCMMFI